MPVVLPGTPDSPTIRMRLQNEEDLFPPSLLATLGLATANDGE